jgi:hypothetical protein
MIEANGRIEIKASPLKMFLLAAASLGFVAAGVWMVQTLPGGAFAHLMGWLAILFFGLCAVGWCWQAFSLRGNVVVMDRNGILDRRVSDHPIPWDKVQAISTWSNENQKIIILKLDPAFDDIFPTKTITRMTRSANAKLGADGIPINPMGLKLSYDELMAATMQFWESKRT